MSPKEKKQLIVIVTGIAIMAFSFIGNSKSSKKKAQPASPAAAAQAAPSAAPSQSPTQSDKTPASQKEREKLSWGRNPFIPLATGKELQKSNLELKGISFGQDKSSYAFINNEIVKIGDNVANYEVVAIEKDKVLLKKGSQTFYVTLME